MKQTKITRKEEKLKAIIERGIKNGWYNPYVADYLLEPVLQQIISGGEHYIVLFSKDFAKAFWGEFPEHHLFDRVISHWGYHIQQAAIAVDPIEYYWKNGGLE